MLKTYPRFFDSTRFTVGLDPVIMGPGVGPTELIDALTVPEIEEQLLLSTISKSIRYVPETSGTKENCSKRLSLLPDAASIDPVCKKL